MLRPESRGTVRIRSTDPFAPPSIQPILTDTDDPDRRSVIGAVRFARQVAVTEPMRNADEARISTR
ncbi:GMC oxidoreductase [Cupriavidus basilensis]